MFRAIVADSPSALSFYAADASLATTKAFTHGCIIFDPQAGTMTVARMAPSAIPAGLVLERGREVNMRLIAADGTVKPQRRSGVIVEAAAGKLRIPGRARTPSRRTAEKGWGYTARKYRAYLTHPGVTGASSLPAWLTDSVARQRQCWNSLVARGRSALRQCSDVSPEQIRAFVNEAILPAVDAFNQKQGRGTKMGHPSYLKVGEPSLAALRRFAGKLRADARHGKAVPESLEIMVTEWLDGHFADYTPIQEFERDLDRLIKQEADALQLRFWERRAVGNALLETFTRRRRQKPAFTMGWPGYVAATDAAFGDWGIHYYLHSAGIQADAVFNGGVRGLWLGPPLAAHRTGHPNACGKAFGIRRQFRAAEIAIPDRATGQIWRLPFAILQHQPFPEEAFLKEWKLVQARGKLHLILVMQARRAAVGAFAEGEPVAGMDLGWRRDGSGVRVATIFNPVRKGFVTVFVDLVNRSPHTASRPPFQVFLGPSRRGVRQAMNADREGRPAFLDTIEGCRQLRRSRDLAKDRLKLEIRAILGDAAPVWLVRAGFRALRSLAESATDPALKRLVTAWAERDAPLAALHREYSERIRARLRKGYEWVAHDIGRMLQADGIRVLAIEDRFLAQTAQNRHGADQAALQSGMQYRYSVAPDLLVRTLDQILPSYGVRIAHCAPRNTTRRCHRCGAINEVGSELQFQCSECGAILNQDRNAALNLSSAAVDTVTAARS